jgi:hypothetical protein
MRQPHQWTLVVCGLPSSRHLFHVMENMKQIMRNIDAFLTAEKTKYSPVF